MKVIAVFNQYSGVQEICACFSKINKDTVIFGSESELAEISKEHTVDFVLDLGFSEEVRRWTINLDIAYVLWSLSPDMTQLDASVEETPMRTKDFLFLTDKATYKEWIKKFGTTFYLPFSASDSFITQVRRSGFEYDVLIVTRKEEIELPLEAEYDRIIETRRSPQDIRNISFIKTIMEPSIEKHKYILDKNLLESFMDERINECGMDPFDDLNRQVFLEHYLGELCSIQREMYFNEICLTGHRVSLFGDPGAEAVLKPYKNAALYPDFQTQDLPGMYNSAKININLTPVKYIERIPQRVFNILAAGGFVLSNYSEELASVFKPGIHIETFKTIQEMIEKIHFYMTNENARLKIAINGQQEFLKFHSMESRLSYISLQRFSKKVSMSYRS